MSTQFLTTDEVAERLRVPADWVRIHARELAGQKIGKYWRFREDRFLEALDALDAA